MCGFFVCVYTLHDKYQNNASIFNITKLSDEKVNLVGASERKKLKTSISCQKRRENKKNMSIQPNLT